MDQNKEPMFDANFPHTTDIKNPSDPDQNDIP